jgi:hypothetical protein
MSVAAVGPFAPTVLCGEAHSAAPCASESDPRWYGYFPARVPVAYRVQIRIPASTFMARMVKVSDVMNAVARTKA